MGETWDRDGEIVLQQVLVPYDSRGMRWSYSNRQDTDTTQYSIMQSNKLNYRKIGVAPTRVPGIGQAL